MFDTDNQNQSDQNNQVSPAVAEPVTVDPPVTQAADVPFGDAIVRDNSPHDFTSGTPVSASAAATAPSQDDLISIKQEALQSLSPLVGHLEQTPEEKFRTTMMMIQASDDQSLVKVAYEAAKQIADDKTRAQALLDIVNEINYFTQQHNS